MTGITLKTILERDLKNLKKEINLFVNPSHLWELLPGTTNSTGNLALHLVGNLRYYIGSILGNSGYVRNRDLEFSAKNLSVDKINNQIDNCINEIVHALTLMDDDALTQEFPIEFLGSKTSSLHVVVHLISHFNYHLGQINYHRRYFSTIDAEL